MSIRVELSEHEARALLRSVEFCSTVFKSAGYEQSDGNARSVAAGKLAHALEIEQVDVYR